MKFCDVSTTSRLTFVMDSFNEYLNHDKLSTYITNDELYNSESNFGYLGKNPKIWLKMEENSVELAAPLSADSVHL